MGGEIVRQMPEEIKQKLEANEDNKVKLKNNPENLLEEISQKFLAEEDK